MSARVLIYMSVILSFVFMKQANAHQTNWSSMSGNYQVLNAETGKLYCDRHLEVTNSNEIIEIIQCSDNYETSKYSYVAENDVYGGFSKMYTNGNYLAWKIKYELKILSPSMLQLTEEWTDVETEKNRKQSLLSHEEKSALYLIRTTNSDSFLKLNFHAASANDYPQVLRLRQSIALL